MLRGLGARLGRQLLPTFNAVETIGQRGVKETTGIVGLEVVPNARSVLRERCEEVVKALSIIPEDAEYRRSVESTMRYRIKLIEVESTDEELEDTFGYQLEQLIETCKDELSLIPQMAEWKPWETPPGHKVEVIVEEDVPEGEALPRRKNPLPE